MATPLVSRTAAGLRSPRSVTRRDLVEDTAHYGGPSPWGSTADRSTPARFAATTDHQRCPSIWRAWQAYHMDAKGWQDIAYSSGVCPHGTRYEGRGHDVRTAANGTTAGNDASHATCYIAGDGDPLTDEAMAAFADESARLEGLRKGHRDWKATACPGDPLYIWVHGGQPVPGPPPTIPEPPEDDDMPAARKVKLAKTSPQQYAYVLPDGLVVDVDHKGNPLVDGAGSVGAFDAVYGTGDALAVQVDIVQAAIARTRGTMTADIEAKLGRIDIRLAALVDIESREEQRDRAAQG